MVLLLLSDNTVNGISVLLQSPVVFACMPMFVSIDLHSSKPCFPFSSSIRIRFIRSHRPHAAPNKYSPFLKVVLMCVPWFKSLRLLRIKILHVLNGNIFTATPLGFWTRLPRFVRRISFRPYLRLNHRTSSHPGSNSPVTA